MMASSQLTMVEVLYSGLPYVRFGNSPKDQKGDAKVFAGPPMENGPTTIESASWQFGTMPGMPGMLGDAGTPTAGDAGMLGMLEVG